MHSWIRPPCPCLSRSYMTQGGPDEANAEVVVSIVKLVVVCRAKGIAMCAVGIFRASVVVEARSQQERGEQRAGGAPCQWSSVLWQCPRRLVAVVVGGAGDWRPWQATDMVQSHGAWCISNLKVQRQTNSRPLRLPCCCCACAFESAPASGVTAWGLIKASESESTRHRLLRSEIRL